MLPPPPMGGLWSALPLVCICPFFHEVSTPPPLGVVTELSGCGCGLWVEAMIV